MRHTRFQGAIVRDDWLLLVKHYSHASDRSYWVFPGGGIEPDESEVECVVREMREETGLDVTVERLLVDERTPSDRFYRRQRTYLCRASDGEPAAGCEPETDHFDIVDVGWFDLASPESWCDRVSDDQWVLPVIWEVRRKLGYPGDRPATVAPIERFAPPDPYGFTLAPDATAPSAELRSTPPHAPRTVVLRAPVRADLEAIHGLLEGTAPVDVLPRWTFEHDLLAGSALVADAEGSILGLASAGEQGRACLAGVPWEYRERAMTLHRFAVSPDAAGTGVEPALLAAVEAEAARLAFDVVRIDAVAARIVGATALECRGYRQAGVLDASDGGMCYEGRVEDIIVNEGEAP